MCLCYWKPSRIENKTKLKQKEGEEEINHTGSPPHHFPSYDVAPPIRKVSFSCASKKVFVTMP